MMMTPWQSVRTCFLKYADFTGRAQRSEYWWFVLFQALANGFGTLLDAIIYQIPSDDAGPLGSIVAVILLVPYLAVTVRRLHDGDRSGWWLLVPWVIFIPLGILSFALNIDWLIGLSAVISAGLFILIFVWFVMRGTDGPNRFGEDPLAIEHS